MTNRPPREAYTSASSFDEEQRSVFADAWIFAGTIQDFSEAGDYRTVKAGKAPISVVRDRDGTLRGFHNVCRHRGAQLLDDAQGNCGSVMVCPYHRWTYGLDGGLRGIPNMAELLPGLDRSALGLKPAAIGVFQHLVFVNPDPGADFDKWTAALAGRQWPHDLAASDVKEATPLLYDIRCDWKVYIENALDGYHLAYLHENTLGGPEPGLNIWEKAGDHMIWYSTEEGIRHRMPLKVRNEAGSWGVIKSASEPGYGGVYYLFPTTLIVPIPYGISVSAVIPVAAGRCRLAVRHWVGPWQSTDERKHVPGYDMATGIISSDKWTKHPLETGDFQTEDVWICEKVQRGLESPAYEHGPLSQGAGAEDALVWFHDLLAKRSGK